MGERGLAKKVVRIPADADLPLMGCVAFGLIDRGTNLIQVRPISGCNLNCVFCSVDEGPNSKTRIASFIVDLDYLLDWLRRLVKFKAVKDVEAHVDAAGEPTLYPKFKDLIHGLSSIEEVKVVSLQTNGTILRPKDVADLEAAGLTRVNLSVNAMDENLAKKLSGSGSYDLRAVLSLAEEIANSGIDLLLAPVWIPKLNDDEIPKIIDFALKIGCGKEYPPIGIQKYEVHKFGRKVPGVRQQTWFKFYAQLERLEKRKGVKLKLGPRDFGIHKAPKVPLVYRKGEVASIKVECVGWVKGEVIGASRNRCITVVGGGEELIGSSIKAKVTRCGDNIYVAKRI